MSKFLHYFDELNDFENAYDDNYKEPWASWIDSINRADYNKSEEEKTKYLRSPLTFEIISGGVIYFTVSEGDSYMGQLPSTINLQYSVNGGEWTTLQLERSQLKLTGTINVNDGDIVKFKGNNNTFCEAGDARHGCSSIFSTNTCVYKLSGNIMSIIDSTNFATVTSLSYSYTFYRLFGYCTGLTSAKHLILPATTLTQYCYRYMFQGCTSLTTAPELPATTLAKSCYESMFYHCSNLNYVKCLATNRSAEYCLYNWLNGVASSGTFIKHPNSGSWSSGASGIPSNWTVKNATL